MVLIKVVPTVITIIMTELSALQVARLLQLCSANLPVGGFSFSQSLEQAVERGWVDSADALHAWLKVLLKTSVAHTDVPLLKWQYRAISNSDIDDFNARDNWIAATRESEEILLAEQAMGKALNRLLSNLHDKPQGRLTLWVEKCEARCFISQFALAAHVFGLDVMSCLSGYVWTLLDNQVAAGTKLIPLGQTDGQNLLFRLTRKIADTLAIAEHVKPETLGQSLPSMAMASAWHEQQYSRLFRS